MECFPDSFYSFTSGIFVGITIAVVFVVAFCRYIDKLDFTDRED